MSLNLIQRISVSNALLTDSKKRQADSTVTLAVGTIEPLHLLQDDRLRSERIVVKDQDGKAHPIALTPIREREYLNRFR
jgi:hypothetical protein